MPFMTRLPGDLAEFGLRVETVPGWETRGSSVFAPACVVGHWTAGPRGSVTRPSLNVVTNGRPGLDGPLCNVYLARDGVCVVVAAGRANHAGAGSFRGLVGNSAAYGIEAEAADNADWTPAQRAAYPRLVAAMLHGLGRDASWFCGHSEWAGPRKQDINGYTPNDMRAQAAATLANPALEDDVTEQDIAEIVHRVLDTDVGGGSLAEFVRTNNKSGAIPEAVWAHEIDRPNGAGKMATGELLGWMDLTASQARDQAAAVATLAAQRAGLSDADIARVADAVADITAEDVANHLTISTKS